jgi:hypothetical protein
LSTFFSSNPKLSKELANLLQNVFFVRLTLGEKMAKKVKKAKYQSKLKNTEREMA